MHDKSDWKWMKKMDVWSYCFYIFSNPKRHGIFMLKTKKFWSILTPTWKNSRPLSLVDRSKNNTRQDRKKRTFSERETGVTRHNGGHIKGYPSTHQYDNAGMVHGVSGVPLIVPHDAKRRKQVYSKTTRLIAVVFPSRQYTFHIRVVPNFGFCLKCIPLPVFRDILI